MLARTLRYFQKSAMPRRWPAYTGKFLADVEAQLMAEARRNNANAAAQPPQHFSRFHGTKREDGAPIFDLPGVVLDVTCGAAAELPLEVFYPLGYEYFDLVDREKYGLDNAHHQLKIEAGLSLEVPLGNIVFPDTNATFGSCLPDESTATTQRVIDKSVVVDVPRALNMCTGVLPEFTLGRLPLRDILVKPRWADEDDVQSHRNTRSELASLVGKTCYLHTQQYQVICSGFWLFFLSNEMIAAFLQTCRKHLARNPTSYVFVMDYVDKDAEITSLDMFGRDRENSTSGTKYRTCEEFTELFGSIDGLRVVATRANHAFASNMSNWPCQMYALKFAL